MKKTIHQLLELFEWRSELRLFLSFWLRSAGSAFGRPIQSLTIKPWDLAIIEEQ